MKTGTIVAILAAFLAVGLGSHQANADGRQTDSDFSNYHRGGTCNQGHRIGTTWATCLHAIDEGFKWAGGLLGHAHWVRNECSEYGTVVAHVDRINYADLHWHLSNGNKHRHTGMAADIRGIYCCINDSDLCWKDQVEKNTYGMYADTVRLIQVQGSSYHMVHVNVGTHENRYRVCNSGTWWDDTLYCSENPDGDAYILPASMQPDPNGATMEQLRARPCGGEGQPECSCGDHICDRFDCEWHFNRSPAMNVGVGGRGNCRLERMTVDEDDNRLCTVEGRCNTNVYRQDAEGTGHSPNDPVTYTNWVWNMDDVSLCFRIQPAPTAELRTPRDRADNMFCRGD